MVAFITDYIHSCVVFVAAANPSTTSHLALIISSRLENNLGLNLNGLHQGAPLSNGHDTILVVLCHLTKMALFIPTFQDIDAEDLASHLLVTGLHEAWHTH